MKWVVLYKPHGVPNRFYNLITMDKMLIWHT